MDFILYIKCIQVLAAFLCGGDSVCIEMYNECVLDGESIIFCADDLMLEYDPNTSMFCVKKGYEYEW